MNKFKKMISVISVTILAIMLVVFTEPTAQSVADSIYLCINIIIPSMFAYMVLSSYILSSGIYKTLFKPLYMLSKRILPLSEELFAVFCLSLIGGYPVGIKLLKEIIAQNKNYSAIASRASAFTYCISPTFAVTMIGLGLYGSAEVGIIIYASNLIACFITAIITGHLYNMKSEITLKRSQNGLIEAINSSSSALFGICAVIIAFNVAITSFEAALGMVGLELPAVIKAMIEISNILKIETPDISLLPVVSAISSIGGGCVLFQCCAIINNSFSLKRFLLSRLPVGTLSALATFILLKFWEISLPAFSEGGKYSFEFEANKAVIVLLLIMCTILLQKNEKIFKKG